MYHSPRRPFDLLALGATLGAGLTYWLIPSQPPPQLTATQSFAQWVGVSSAREFNGQRRALYQESLNFGAIPAHVNTPSRPICDQSPAQWEAWQAQHEAIRRHDAIAVSIFRTPRLRTLVQEELDTQALSVLEQAYVLCQLDAYFRNKPPAMIEYKPELWWRLPPETWPGQPRP